MSNQDGFNHILKSSSLMAMASALVILFGIFRTKISAIYIGPIGIGIFSSLMGLQGLAGTFSGFGVQASAVKSIAENSTDIHQLSRTVKTVFRVSFITGVLGSLSIILLSGLISNFLFGNRNYSYEISLMGPTILFLNLTGAQTAILQGLRKTPSLATMNVISGFIGVVFAFGVYRFYGVSGIPFVILLTVFFNYIMGFMFLRVNNIIEVELTWRETLLNASNMLKNGAAFMSTSVMGSAVIFFTNSQIINLLDLKSLGVYSAALILSGMVTSFVMSAMSTDFYPRLAAIPPGDHKSLNGMINQQIEVGFYLCAPCILAVLLSSPFLIKILYTAEFIDAIELLKILSFGALLRVASWPLGYVLMATGKAKEYFLIEFFSNLIHLILNYYLLEFYGLNGLAVAFFVSSLIYLVVIFYFVKSFTKFNWSFQHPHMFRCSLVVLMCSITLQFLNLKISGMILSVFFLFSAVLISYKALNNSLNAKVLNES